MVAGLDQLIDITPGTLGGKPRLAGHRISVADVSVWHFRMGMSLEQISAHYNIALAKLYAAIAYYLEHREEIDKRLDADRAYVEQERKKNPSIVKTKLQTTPNG
ncbi:MAG TPA: DUF433 domain-containing protein [Planctomycetota bacterium]